MLGYAAGTEAFDEVEAGGFWPEEGYACCADDHV